MYTPDRYEAYKDRQRRQDQTRKLFQVATRLEGTDGSNPSSEHLAAWVASRTGRHSVSEDLVRDNYDLFREAESRAWAEKQGRKAPILLASLADPKNGGITRAEADALAGIEQTVSSVNGAPGAIDGDQAPQIEGAGELSATGGLGAEARVSIDAADVPTSAAPYETISAPASVEGDELAAAPRGDGSQASVGGNIADAPTVTAGEKVPGTTPSVEGSAQAFSGAAPGAEASASADLTDAASGALGDTEGYGAPYSDVEEEGSEAPSEGAKHGKLVGGWLSVGADLPPAPNLSDRDAYVDRIVNASGASDEEMIDLRRWVSRQPYFDVDDLDDLLSRTYAGETPPNIARAELEPLLAPVTNAIARGLLGLATSYQHSQAESYRQRSLDQGRSFSEILYDEKLVKNSILPGPDELWGAGVRWLQAGASSLSSEENLAASIYYEQKAGETYQRSAETPHSVAATRYFNLANDPLADQSFWGRLKEEPIGFGAAFLESMIEGTTLDAAAAMAAVVTRSPTFGAAVALGGSAAQERYGSPVEYLMRKKIDISTLEGASLVINNPKLFHEAVAYGQQRALVIALMDGASGHIAGQALAKNPIFNALAQISTPAGVAMTGETLAQIASKQPLDLEAIVVKGLGALAHGLAQEGGKLFGKVGGKGLEGAEVSVRQFDVVRDLSKKIRELNLRKNNPEFLNGLIGKVTEKAGISHIYISADDFVSYFKRQRSDPKSVLSRLGVSSHEIDAVIQSGGDFRLSTSSVLATFAGTKAGDFLLQRARFDAGRPTLDKALEQNRKGWAMILELSNELSKQYPTPNGSERR